MRQLVSQHSKLIGIRCGWACCLLVGVMVFSAGCSPRYTVYKVSGDGFQIDKDAWVAPDTALLVAYDFWSLEGQPFVSMLNPGWDTAYVDLVRSTVLTDAFGRVSLLDVLGGGPGSRRRDVRAAYPDLRLSESEREPQLLLLPENWVSFYGLATSTSTAIDWHSRRGEEAALTMEYVWTQAGVSRINQHQFGVTALERLRKRDYRRYGATLAGPDRYFVDRGPARRQQTLQVALEVGTAVLIAF